MKLSDQEQVILKAIGHGVVEIAQVIKRVGYPKAAVKKILIGLSNKGVVTLYRHDWSSSLTPAQRKLMVRHKGNYYGAVSVRERNPRGKHLRGATAKEQRQYEAILKEIRKSGRYKGREKEVAARTVRARAKNKSGKGKEALKTTGRALKKAASSVLGAGSQILGAGSKALNPKRKKRSKKRAKRNATRTVHAVSKTRRTVAVRKTSRRAKSTKSRQNVATKRSASKSTKARSVAKARKGATRRLAGRAIKKSSGLLKRGRKNPSAESIRKKFSGRVSGERDLYFPQGTPQGLAKLGRLVSITTEEGTIKPVHGSAWLCADTKERLHIGSTTNAPLYSGPARSFGNVTKVEYESSKPHLGYKGPIIWFHHMGERGGTRPTLHADGKGGLKFRGGKYTLTTRGIEH